MLNRILILIALIAMESVFSQEEIVTFKNSLKNSSSFLKDVIPIVNQKNDDISICFMDSKIVYAYLLNSNFKVTHQLSSGNIGNDYDWFIGSSISDNNDYTVYLTNKWHNKFALINFSYRNNSVHFKEFHLKFEDEKFVQTVVYDNKLYVISIINNSSKLNIYSLNFDNNLNYIKTQINLSNVDFINKKGEKVSFYDLINVYLYSLRKNTFVKKVIENNPKFISINENHTKLYLRGDKIVFSFDQNKDETRLVIIDLNTFEKQIKQFKKPINQTESKHIGTNSLIYNDYMFMIVSTKKNLIFSIQDYYSENLIQEYSATLNETISFKNSPIIKKLESNRKTWKTEKTKILLSAMTYGHAGISVDKFNNIYQIILGSKIKGKDKVMTYYIKCLFDNKFNHIDNKFQDNVFDEIKNFKEKKAILPMAQVVFKYKNYYILGNYFSWSKEYRLRKFKD